jgi:menaquinone-dependent protoporphyrinogen oxidase
MNAPTVLVAYGTRNGSTEGIAGLIAVALENEGVAASVRPAGDVGDLSGYDAVVLGGALYTGRWHHDARRFVHRHAQVLVHIPVWLFTSGPSDEAAGDRDIPSVARIAEAARRLGARGHMTFGGRRADRRPKRFAGKTAIRNGRGGELRHAERIAAWARTIAAELHPLYAYRMEDVSS